MVTSRGAPWSSVASLLLPDLDASGHFYGSNARLHSPPPGMLPLSTGYSVNHLESLLATVSAPTCRHAERGRRASTKAQGEPMLVGEVKEQQRPAVILRHRESRDGVSRGSWIIVQRRETFRGVWSAVQTSGQPPSSLPNDRSQSQRPTRAMRRSRVETRLSVRSLWSTVLCSVEMMCWMLSVECLGSCRLRSHFSFENDASSAASVTSQFLPCTGRR